MSIKNTLENIKRGKHSEVTKKKISDSVKRFVRKTEKYKNHKNRIKVIKVIIHPYNKQGGYYSIHVWLKYLLGKANHCDICGKLAKKHENKNAFEWSCRTGNMERNLKNWWQLCKRCHVRYDRNFLKCFSKSKVET